MSFFDLNREGKLGLVELCGAGSTKGRKAPTERHFRVNRIREKLIDFCFKGRVDGHACLFRIDTGSDVSVLKLDLLGKDKHLSSVFDSRLCYPTGETVSVSYKANVAVEIGKFTLE
jgi:hypothetical protein